MHAMHWTWRPVGDRRCRRRIGPILPAAVVAMCHGAETGAGPLLAAAGAAVIVFLAVVQARQGVDRAGALAGLVGALAGVVAAVAAVFMSIRIAALSTNAAAQTGAHDGSLVAGYKAEFLVSIGISAAAVLIVAVQMRTRAAARDTA
jgi:hypothetical protein